MDELPPQPPDEAPDSARSPDEASEPAEQPGEAAGPGPEDRRRRPPQPELGPEEWYSGRPRPAREGSRSTDEAPLRLGPLGPIDAPTDLAGWLAAVGLLLALGSLLLPWVTSEGFVLGAPGSLPRSYTAAWGLAAGSNWSVAILLLAAFVLALRTPPDRLRHGIGPLSVGLFGLGNLWPYLPYIGLGWVAQGVWVMALGCLLAVAGGVIRLGPSLRPER